MPIPPLRHALRRLWRDRSITLVALAILALGIGASTSLFTVVNAVLLKPLPFPAAGRLVVVRIVVPGFQERYPSVPVNAGHIAAWRDHCRTCDGLAAIKAMTTTLTGNGLNGPGAAAFDGQRILVTNVTAGADRVSLWKAADLSPLGNFGTGAGTVPTAACSDGINFWITLRSPAGHLARF